MASSTVRVALRIRPLSPSEHLNGETECVTQLPDVPQIVIGADRAFTFDHVFSPEVAQEQVYDESIKPLVSQFLQGYNATILAYGQTGSGKTFSMGTGPSSADTESQGVVPRAISEIWNHLEQRAQGGLTYSIDVSFLELYNEDLIDLLNPRAAAAGSGRGPSIREDSRGNMVLVGVERQRARAQTDILELLHQGALSRTTASTDMNRTSSRSHAIFTVHLRQQDRRSLALLGDGEAGMDGGPSIVSKIHFVDLAGSERIKRTGAAGDRAREGISINAGLLALGNVISALGTASAERGPRRAPHVPYRDSKLTRLLQDSLGGNSQTLMLACISPSSRNSSESLNTIRYANRARNIRNKVAVNFDKNSSAELSMLKTEVARLRGELSKLKLQRRQSSIGLDAEGEVERLQRRNADLGQRLGATAKRVAALEQERDALRGRVRELGGSAQSTPGLPAAALPADGESTRPNSLFAESHVLETIDRELSEQAARHEHQIGSVRRHYEAKLELLQETLGIVQKERDVALQRLANAGTSSGAQPAGTPSRLRVPSRMSARPARAATPQLRKPSSVELHSRPTPPPPALPRFGTSLGLTATSPAATGDPAQVRQLQDDVARLRQSSRAQGEQAAAERERLTMQIAQQAEEISQLRQQRTGRRTSNRYSLLAFKDAGWTSAAARSGGDDNDAPQLLRAAFVKAVLEGELQRCVRARQLLRERDAFLTRQDRLMNEQNDMLLCMQGADDDADDSEQARRAGERIEIIDAELHYLDLKVRDTEAEVAQLAEPPLADDSDAPQLAPITNLSGLAMRMVEDVVRIDYAAFAALFENLPRADATGLAYLLLQDLIELRLVALRDERERDALEKQLMDSRRTLLAMQRTALNAALSYERELDQAERRLNLTQSPAELSPSFSDLHAELRLSSIADSTELTSERSAYEGVRDRGILLRSALMSALEDGSEPDVSPRSPSPDGYSALPSVTELADSHDYDDSMYSASLGVSGLQSTEPSQQTAVDRAEQILSDAADMLAPADATRAESPYSMALRPASTPIEPADLISSSSSDDGNGSADGQVPGPLLPDMFLSDPEYCESDTIPELYRSVSGEFFRLPNLARKRSARQQQRHLVRRLTMRKQMAAGKSRRRPSKRRRGSLRKPRISLPIVPPELVDYIERRNPNALSVGNQDPVIAPPELVREMHAASSQAARQQLLPPPIVLPRSAASPQPTASIGSDESTSVFTPRVAARIAAQITSGELSPASKETLDASSPQISELSAVEPLPLRQLRSPPSFYHQGPYLHSNQISYKSAIGASPVEPVYCPPLQMPEQPAAGMVKAATSPTHRYLSPTERANASLFSMMDAGRAQTVAFPPTSPPISAPPLPDKPLPETPKDELPIDRPLGYKPSRIRRRAQSSYDPRTTLADASSPKSEPRAGGRRLSKFFNGFGFGGSGGTGAKKPNGGRPLAPGGMASALDVGRDRSSSESTGSRIPHVRKIHSTIDDVTGGQPWAGPGSRPVTSLSNRNSTYGYPSFL